jgi:GNAT superfamily N-acetyltransferase
MVPRISVNFTEEALANAKKSIVLSFSSDPMMRWMVPSQSDYETTMPEVFEAFVCRAAEHETVYVAKEGSAVAVWLPPEVEADSDRMTVALRKVVVPQLYDDIGAMFGEMGSFHSKATPCWYLPLIGVAPSMAGQGLGSALMKKALSRGDALGLPFYLDSSNPKNVPFYNRFGFEVMGEIQHGSSPIVYPMFRKPRG